MNLSWIHSINDQKFIFCILLLRISLEPSLTVKLHRTVPFTLYKWLSVGCSCNNSKYNIIHQLRNFTCSATTKLRRFVVRFKNQRMLWSIVVPDCKFVISKLYVLTFSSIIVFRCSIVLSRTWTLLLWLSISAFSSSRSLSKSPLFFIKLRNAMHWV